MRQRITFDKIQLKAVKRFVDPETGKKRQQTKIFWQTQNPFNKRDGMPKSREQIMQELIIERDTWLAQP